MLGRQYEITKTQWEKLDGRAAAATINKSMEILWWTNTISFWMDSCSHIYAHAINILVNSASFATYGCGM